MRCAIWKPRQSFKTTTGLPPRRDSRTRPNHPRDTGMPTFFPTRCLPYYVRVQLKFAALYAIEARRFFPTATTFRCEFGGWVSNWTRLSSETSKMVRHDGRRFTIEIALRGGSGKSGGPKWSKGEKQAGGSEHSISVRKDEGRRSTGVWILY